MKICKNCYYFKPKENRVCQRVFCNDLDREIHSIVEKSLLLRIPYNEFLKNFTQIITDIVLEDMK